jgi:peptide/nickel transport system substrate-binding protein
MPQLLRTFAFCHIITFAIALVHLPGATAAQCLRYAGVETGGELLNLDPILQNATQNSIMVGVVFNRLMDLDSDFEVSPELAKSWSSNTDATQWTFHLRDDVRWHDGTLFTAADVVYTYRRLIDPTLGSEAAATLAFLNPDGIIAVDDTTLRFDLDAPVSELPLLITTKNTWIVQNGAGPEQLRLTPIGTGPFTPVDFNPAQEPFLFERNPDYWEAGLPLSPCIEFVAIQEATTMAAALMSGEVDIAQQVDFSILPALEHNRQVELTATGPATSVVLAAWVDTPPFDDVRVRQALKKVIDRQVMVETALLGYGVIGDDNPMPPGSRYSWRDTVPGPDVEGAKALLAQAGYNEANPLAIELYTSEYIPGATLLAQIFKEQAAAAGIRVTLIIGPASDYWDNVWLKHPFVGSGWLMRSPGEALTIAYRSNAQAPETHWFREDFDALVEAAIREPDVATRRALYQKAARILSQEGGAIIPVFQQIVAAVRSGCSGYEPHVQLSRADLRKAVCD